MRSEGDHAIARMSAVWPAYSRTGTGEIVSSRTATLGLLLADRALPLPSLSKSGGQLIPCVRGCA